MPSTNKQKAYDKKRDNTDTGRRLYNYKRSAKKRSIDFLLTDNEVINFFFMDCHYCGVPPDINVQLMGIDRKNSSKGYLMDNVVPCCKMCNYCKNTLDYKEFLDHVENMFNHLLIGKSHCHELVGETTSGQSDCSNCCHGES